MLDFIASVTLQYIPKMGTIIDWRYEMLCAYYNAGGDLYVKNKAGKYVWQCCSLPLTATAFLLEHGIDIDNDFDSLWNGREDNIKVIEFPDVVKEKLVSYKNDTPNLNLDKIEIEDSMIETLPSPSTSPTEQSPGA